MVINHTKIIYLYHYLLILLSRYLLNCSHVLCDFVGKDQSCTTMKEKVSTCNGFKNVFYYSPNVLVDSDIVLTFLIVFSIRMIGNARYIKQYLFIISLLY